MNSNNHNISEETNQLRNSSEETNQLTNSSEEREDNTVLDSIDLTDICYLCVHYSDGRCGATLYHSNSHSIQVITELEDNDFDSLETILVQTEPNHVIISSKSDPKLIELLEECSKQRRNKSDDKSLIESMETSCEVSTDRSVDRSVVSSELLWKMEFPFELHIESYTSFDFSKAKNRILSINAINHLVFNEENERMLYLSSIFDFCDDNTLKSFGALLRFLDFNSNDIQMQTNRSTVEISTISRLYLQRLVSIERNSYESLQIFQQEWHPSAAKQGIDYKEGLSLYGLFNCCVSKIGANFLRKIFLMPTQEIDIIVDRHKAIEFFIEPKNHILRDNLNQHLKHIKPMTGLLNRLTTYVTLTVNDLQTLSDNLMNALRIRDLIDGQNSWLQIFDQIKELFNDEMDRLFQVIQKLVDFDKSVKSQSFEINVGIDKELDQIKYEFIHLPQLLEEVAQNELNKFSNAINQCNVVYVPQLGFMTSVPALDGAEAPHILNTQLKLVVRAGDRYYYKTYATEELDKKYGDIQSEITDRQIQIINQLLELIIYKKHLFVNLVKSCAKLDALIAMSRTALFYKYTKPNLTTEGVIEIINGRHPLIELLSDNFVPNDYLSGGQHKKVKLISGPNACGKSVYLKQISLIVYLAHIGSYVPAFRANIPIVDRMFTRIHTPESISFSLSTFMLDLKQMSNATKNSTKRSLVVIDEFGKGTKPVDGISLLSASIDHWINGETPHLVVASHFRCLPSLINRNDAIDCQCFQFDRTPNAMKYLFKLSSGHFKESIASHIAYVAGIPIDIIKRGLELCQKIANNEKIELKVTQDLSQRYKKFKEIAKIFLKLNITSEEQLKDFFETNFTESSTTEE